MFQIFTCFLLGCVVLTVGRPGISFSRKVTTEEQKKLKFIVSIGICGSNACRTCTGMLVGTRVVLTAAHCFCQLKGKLNIQVWANSLKMRRGTQRVGRLLRSQRSKYNCDEHYRLQVGRDVALIGINQALSGIEPVLMFCGTFAGNVLPSKGIVLGYGLNSPTYGGDLRIATGMTIPCPEVWQDMGAYCMGADSNVPLTNETGGPLLMESVDGYQLVGVLYTKTAITDWTYLGFTTLRLWTGLTSHCQWIKNTKYAGLGQRPSVGMAGVMIQSFVVFVVLNFQRRYLQ